VVYKRKELSKGQSCQSTTWEGRESAGGRKKRERGALATLNTQRTERKKKWAAVISNKKRRVGKDLKGRKFAREGKKRKEGKI